jgi:tetratricopeptide (TPR) repeat protein
MNAEAEAALQEYYEAAVADPGNEELILEVSRRFLQNKQPQKALEIVNRAANLPDASGAIFARLGLVYSQLGRREEAIAADRKAIKRSPQALAGYQNLFVNFLQTKREPDALRVLEEAARQPNTDVEFLLGLSELYASFILQAPSQREKVKTAALAVLNRAEKLAPANPPLRMKLADTFDLLGDFKKAAQIYLELLKKLPDFPSLREQVHAKLVNLYLRDHDSKRAMEQLEAFLRDDPTNPQAYYFLGRLFYEEKKPAEAAEYFTKALLFDATLERAYYYLALCQININKASEALATIEKARQRFPQSYDMEFWTGLAYSQQKSYAEAIRHFTAAEVMAKATDSKRADEDLYFQLGAAYERTGDYAQAEQYFEKCLQLAPDAPEALNYLGYMWAEHGKKLDKARELIEKAVKAKPDSAAYLDSLAWVLFKLGQPKAALDHALKAVKLSPEPDATLFDHLGDIYAKLNQPEKAREAWTKSLSLEANPEVQKKIGTPATSPAPAQKPKGENQDSK